MDGEIVNENDEGIAVDVVDNNGVTHEITIEKSSREIVYHVQDGYPDDASKREYWEDEAVSQARRFAHYYATQQTANDALPWDLDPDRFETVRQAIADLSDDQLEQYFGEYFRQLAGYYDDDIDQPSSLPPDADPRNPFRQYRLDVYLDDADRVEATSGVHIMYYAGVDDDRVVRGEDPFPDRDPDAQLQHVPVDITWDGFRNFLDYHLRCQIRDCYIGMGLEPPEEYRVLGIGLSKFALKYMHFDFYPPYHDYDADVEGYRSEDLFNLGRFGSLLDLF